MNNDDIVFDENGVGNAPLIYPCPICLTQNQLSAERHYEVCSVCGWEDDDLQYEEPDYEDGANLMSLNEAKRMWQSGESLYSAYPNPKKKAS